MGRYATIAIQWSLPFLLWLMPKLLWAQPNPNLPFLKPGEFVTAPKALAVHRIEITQPVFEDGDFWLEGYVYLTPDHVHSFGQKENLVNWTNVSFLAGDLISMLFRVAICVWFDGSRRAASQMDFMWRVTPFPVK